MKIKEKLIEDLERQELEVARKRLARQLAPIVVHLVGIHPHGIDLVMWLATPDCRTNLDAAVCWIVKQLNDPSFATPDRPTPVLDLLVSRMTRTLAKVEASSTVH